MQTGALLLLCATAANAADPPIPYPHPVITEVLYAVSSDGAADPNRDGVSDVVADEFVEIMNPHDRAIDLAGYALTDAQGFANPSAKRGFLFVFPALRLGPGEVAVVFNGRAGADARDFGGLTASPSRPHADFAGAWVYSTSNTNPNRAFANGKDMVVLNSPDGEVLDVVIWGEPDQVERLRPEYARRVEVVAGKKGQSVQRPGPWAPMAPHRALAEADWSPGAVPPPPNPPDRAPAPPEPVPPTR